MHLPIVLFPAFLPGCSYLTHPPRSRIRFQPYGILPRQQMGLQVSWSLRVINSQDVESLHCLRGRCFLLFCCCSHAIPSEPATFSFVQWDYLTLQDPLCTDFIQLTVSSHSQQLLPCELSSKPECLSALQLPRETWIKLPFHFPATNDHYLCVFCYFCSVVQSCLTLWPHGL